MLWKSTQGHHLKWGVEKGGKDGPTIGVGLKQGLGLRYVSGGWAQQTKVGAGKAAVLQACHLPTQHFAFREHWTMSTGPSGGRRHHLRAFRSMGHSALNTRKAELENQDPCMGKGKTSWSPGKRRQQILAWPCLTASPCEDITDADRLKAELEALLLLGLYSGLWSLGPAQGIRVTLSS